jgi:hypothetical protein
VTIRSSEVHLYYNLQVFYWHFLESLWLFIFLVLYLAYQYFLELRSTIQYLFFSYLKVNTSYPIINTGLWKI